MANADHDVTVNFQPLGPIGSGTGDSGSKPTCKPKYAGAITAAVLVIAAALFLGLWFGLSSKSGDSPGPSPAPTPEYSLEFLVGKFDETNFTNFVEVPVQYSNMAGRWLQSDTLNAYIPLNAAAVSELGVNLTIVSATRNFYYQRGIWEYKWTTNPLYCNISGEANRSLAIMMYSAMPSTSQHHYGVAMDLVSLDPLYFTNTTAGRALDMWFQRRLGAFGFCRPYSPKPPRVAGYDTEQWHVAYKPLLQPILNQYHSKVTYADINGFDGSTAAQQIRAIEDYVFGIDPSCWT